MTLPVVDVSFGSNRGYPRDISLRQEGKPSHPVDLCRRNFLIRCCQGASAALFTPRLRGLSFPASGSGDSPNALPGTAFHLHPHYRAQMPLDALLLKTKAGLDSFITEKYADQIAAILANWTSSLLQSPQHLAAIEKTLAQEFSGVSLSPSESRLIRPGPAFDIRQNKFAETPTLSRDAFAKQFASSLNSFSKILTAEFQVTSIDAGLQPPPNSEPPTHLRTRVRYDIVGSGKDFHREQRTGSWDLEWEPSSSPAGSALHSWRSLDETRARCTDPAFLDVASQALGSNPSYSSQLLHGTDYWRTVLDAACGIDIYGHNGVSVGDIDGDGFDDLYICQPAGLPNRSYRNRRDGTFEDITESSGVGVLENTACALFVDFTTTATRT